jgi:haloalkane dehalogenase
MVLRDEESHVISAGDKLPRSTVQILDSEMSYVDVGDGDPVVFLHGNPTSSYLWRNIIPSIAPLRRCLAPDLIGMGRSGKPRSHGYRFVDHARYLDAWFEAVGLTGKVTLVGHDWGGALGFDWAYRHQGAVEAIVYMETFVQPRVWNELSPSAQDFFVRVRSPEGEEMMLNRNGFVEVGLPAHVLRKLSEREMHAYRAPFPNRSSRLPTLVWPREQPIGDEPKDVVEIVNRYGAWMQRSEIPKLFINAEPGSVIVGQAREFCRTWRNQREVTVEGLHFIQEDSPDEIGAAIGEFLIGQKLRGRQAKAR